MNISFEYLACVLRQKMNSDHSSETEDFLLVEESIKFIISTLKNARIGVFC